MTIRTVARHVDRPRSAVERTLGWASFLAFWATATAFALGTGGHLPGDLRVEWWWLLLPVASATLAAALPFLRRRNQVPVTISGACVRVHGLLGWREIRRAQIASGHVSHDEDDIRGVLALTLRTGGIVRIAFAAREHADTALTLLGLTAAERRATLPLASPESRYLRAGMSALAHAVVLFILLGLFGRAGMDVGLALGWGAVSLLSGLFVLRASRLPEIEIGVDALEVRAAMEQKTIDLGEVVSVQRTAAGRLRHPWAEARVSLFLKGGAALHLRTQQSEYDRSPSLGEAIELRIAEARKARGALAGSPRSERIARRGRPLSVWLEDVARIASPACTYRVASMLAADLARIVGDPDASPEQRIGAALALGRSPIRAEQQVVRVAARACISPRLRVALSETLRPHPDEALIEAALTDAEATAEKSEKKPAKQVGGKG